MLGAPVATIHRPRRVICPRPPYAQCRGGRTKSLGRPRKLPLHTLSSDALVSQEQERRGCELSVSVYSYKLSAGMMPRQGRYTPGKRLVPKVVEPCNSYSSGRYVCPLPRLPLAQPVCSEQDILLATALRDALGAISPTLNRMPLHDQSVLKLVDVERIHQASSRSPISQVYSRSLLALAQCSAKLPSSPSPSLSLRLPPLLSRMVAFAFPWRSVARLPTLMVPSTMRRPSCTELRHTSLCFR